MQIASPLFLFLFLPLTLPLLPLCKKKHRKAVMALISVAFFLIANHQSPWGLLPVSAILLLACLLVCIPCEIFSRLRLWLGVSLSLAIFLAARIACELFPQHHTYPLGLGLVTLGAISLCIDHYRADVTERETPLGVVGYLLFFPTLTLGPVLRYKQYLYLAEHASPSLSDFSAGALLYVKGFLKRIAVCTVLFALLKNVLSVLQNDAVLPLPVLSLALVFAFLALYFTVSGITDMSRGLMTLYGYRPPRGQARFFDRVAPHRMLGALLCSLDAFLEDYVGTPLRRLFPGRSGKALAALVICTATLLFYRTHPALLLIALPLLVCAVLLAQTSRYLRRPRARALRIPLMLLSALCLSLVALAMMLEKPLTLFTVLAGAFQKTNLLTLYHVLMTFTYLNHLIVALVFLLLYAPLSRLVPPLVAKLPARVQSAARYAGALITLLAFFLALWLLLPQFPQYDALVYGGLFS